MIKVMKSTDDDRYSNKTSSRPLLYVTHGVGSLEITEFVRVAVETGHLKAVLNGLPESYFIPMNEEKASYEVLRTGELFYPDPFKGTAFGQSAKQRAIEYARKQAQCKEGTYRVVRTEYLIESESQEIKTLKLFGEQRY